MNHKKELSGDITMRCNFEKMVRYLDKQLNIDEKLELFDHLDQCDVCREAMYLLARDRDAALFVFGTGKAGVDRMAS
jgi:anti-sigma factor RsiW